MKYIAILKKKHNPSNALNVLKVSGTQQAADEVLLLDYYHWCITVQAALQCY